MYRQYLVVSGPLIFNLPNISWRMQVTVCEEHWPTTGWRRGYTFFILMTTYIVPLMAIAPAYACVMRELWRHRPPGNSIHARDLRELHTRRRVRIAG